MVPVCAIPIPSGPEVQRRDISVALTNLEKHCSMLSLKELDMQKRSWTEFQAKVLEIIYLLIFETRDGQTIFFIWEHK